jgi:septum formation inhibitor MinC
MNLPFSHRENAGTEQLMQKARKPIDIMIIDTPVRAGQRIYARGAT